MSNFGNLGMALQNCLEDKTENTPELEEIMGSENPFAHYEVGTSGKKRNSASGGADCPIPKKKTETKKLVVVTTKNPAPLRVLAPLQPSSSANRTAPIAGGSMRKVVYNTSSKANMGTRSIVHSSVVTASPKQRHVAHRVINQKPAPQPHHPIVDSGSTTENLLSSIEQLIKMGDTVKSTTSQEKDDDVIVIDDDEEEMPAVQKEYFEGLTDKAEEAGDDCICLSDDDDSQPPTLEKMDSPLRSTTPLTHFC